jgi:F-type H+-transporting ATPase subunit b
MISLDLTIVLQILIFVILWLILKNLLFQPYIALLDERQQKTAGARDRSDILDHESERLRMQYEEGIAKAQAAGYAAKDLIVQGARQQRESILGQAREQAAGFLERARAEIQSELAKERDLLIQEARGVAQEMTAKILGRRVG